VVEVRIIKGVPAAVCNLEAGIQIGVSKHSVYVAKDPDWEINNERNRKGD
jgi:hypothetical protein